ncbi:MAG: hypothetical protein M3463_17705 [Verrucomicrobiota bacterium]|nr:hypothetical protein [Verrucomicrobiota bacterium]
MVLFGSNLGNASSTTRNMPVILVGGGFKQHLHVKIAERRRVLRVKGEVLAAQRLGSYALAFETKAGAQSFTMKWRRMQRRATHCGPDAFPR